MSVFTDGGAATSLLAPRLDRGERDVGVRDIVVFDRRRRCSSSRAFHDGTDGDSVVAALAAAAGSTETAREAELGSALGLAVMGDAFAVVRGDGAADDDGTSPGTAGDGDREARTRAVILVCSDSSMAFFRSAYDVAATLPVLAAPPLVSSLVSAVTSASADDGTATGTVEAGGAAAVAASPPGATGSFHTTLLVAMLRKKMRPLFASSYGRHRLLLSPSQT
jgi:hypothetical protein